MLSAFMESFADLPEPRVHENKIRYKLLDIVVMATCAAVEVSTSMTVSTVSMSVSGTGRSFSAHSACSSEGVSLAKAVLHRSMLIAPSPRGKSRVSEA